MGDRSVHGVAAFLKQLPWKRGLLLALGVHVVAIVLATIVSNISGMAEAPAIYHVIPFGVAEFPAFLISAATLFAMKSLKYLFPNSDPSFRFYLSLAVTGCVHVFAVALQYALIVLWHDSRTSAGAATRQPPSVPERHESATSPPGERLVYEKPWVIVALLFFFWPGGLWMMWKGRVWTQNVRVFITIIVGLIAVLMLVNLAEQGVK